MKFLFWTDGFWPRIGGIETQAQGFMEGMRQRGHEGLVLAQQDDPKGEEPEEYKGISIKRFDFNRIFPTQELKRLKPIENYLEWVLKEFKPDIIHLNACVGWHGLVFLIFRRILRIPFVATIHAPYFYKQPSNPLLGKIIVQADRVCCVSNWVKCETGKMVPESKDKLRLIYNGLPLPDLAAAPLSFSPPTLLVAGRLTLEKGFDTAIAAFALLRHIRRDVKLLIVGNGDDRASLEQLVNVMGLGNSVHFTGAVQKSEVPAWINKATLVIVPSYFESFGLVCLEAMQMGRPVIASAVGGLQEIVVHNETGLLVPPRDPTALADAMQFLIERPELAIEMGMRGHIRAALKFSLNQNVEQYEAIYKELA